MEADGESERRLVQRSRLRYQQPGQGDNNEVGAVSFRIYFGDRADELFLMNWLWGVREREVSGMIGKDYVLCG